MVIIDDCLNITLEYPLHNFTIIRHHGLHIIQVYNPKLDFGATNIFRYQICIVSVMMSILKRKHVFSRMAQSAWKKLPCIKKLHV